MISAVASSPSIFSDSSPSSFNAHSSERSRISKVWQHSLLGPDPILQLIKQETSVWQRLKLAFQKKSPVYRATIALSLQDPNDNWEEAQNTLLQAFESSEYQKLRRPLRIILKKLSEPQLKEVFQKLILKSVESDEEAFVQNCLGLITLGEMQELLGVLFDQNSDEISLRAELWEKSYKALTSSSFDKEVKRFFPSLINFFHSFIDTFLMAFSFFQIGKEPNSSWEASHFLEVYGKMFTVPVIIFAAFTGVVKSSWAAAICTLGTVLLLLAALSAYLKWLKPSPSLVRPFQNMSSNADRGLIEPVTGRDDVIRKIFRCFDQATPGFRTTPLIVGETGGGKNATIDQLVLDLKSGKYPRYANKKVQKVNTSLLIPQAHETDKLQSIKDRLGPDREDEILVFDEAHVALDPKCRAILGKALMTDLDPNPEGFPYVILLTNNEGFRDYFSKESDFLRRLTVIHLHSTNKNSTLHILREIKLREAPEFEISDEILGCIYDLTSKRMPHKPQPGISRTILSKAVAIMRQKHEPVELRDKQEEYEHLCSSYKLNLNKPTRKEIAAKIRKIKQEITLIREGQEKIERPRNLLLKLRKQNAHQKLNLLSLGYKISHEKNKNALDKLKKESLFTDSFLMSYLDDAIKNLEQTVRKDASEAHPLQELNEELIKKLVEEEVANAEATQKKMNGNSWMDWWQQWIARVRK